MQFFLPGSEHFIAIDNMSCFPAPSLTLDDGTLATFVYNHPSHIRGPRSGIEMWVSQDGALWQRRSLTTADDVDWAHANWAVGMNDKCELIVAVSRYRMDESQGQIKREWLSPTVRLSADEGHTWTTVAELPPLEPDEDVMPFGVMVPMPDGQLMVSCYCSKPYTADPSWKNTAFVLRSTDGGRSWGDPSIIEPSNHNETGLLRLDSGHLLAAARTLRCPFPDCQFGLGQFLGGRLDLFESKDLGRSWQEKAILTFPGQHPGNLIQLKDGRILLTYGSRMPGLLGVNARVSEDGGENWSDPIILVNGLDSPDCGYPSTFELEDGRLVTIYYSQSSAWHKRYHMGAVRYRLD